jgi:3-hydroxyisobutyrate dehydrogenase-like beta-hydroxyacid dehydrogenase
VGHGTGEGPIDLARQGGKRRSDGAGVSDLEHLPAHTRIAWIGTGTMGKRLSTRAMQAGFPVTAFDTDPAHLAEIVACGALPAYSVAEAIRNVSVIVSSVPGDEALRAISIGEQGLLSNARQGALFIDTSTVSPHASAEVARAAESWNVRYLRIAMSGTVMHAEEGTLMQMVSGDPSAYAWAKPLLDVFGEKQFFVGHAEEARYAKLVVNLLIAITACGLGEALALGRRGGLDWSQMLDVIAASPAASPMLHYKMPLLRTRQFEPQMTTGLLSNDIGLILAAAKQNGVPVSLCAIAQQMFEARIAHGGGPEDYISIVKLFEWQAGINDEPALGERPAVPDRVAGKT